MRIAGRQGLAYPLRHHAAFFRRGLVQDDRRHVVTDPIAPQVNVPEIGTPQGTQEGFPRYHVVSLRQTIAQLFRTPVGDKGHLAFLVMNGFIGVSDLFEDTPVDGGGIAPVTLLGVGIAGSYDLVQVGGYSIGGPPVIASIHESVAGLMADFFRVDGLLSVSCHQFDEQFQVGMAFDHAPDQRD